MENWKAILYLLASGQGLLLSLALVMKGLRRQRANVFLGLILFVFALEMLNAWGMRVRYHASPSAFPFWTLQSYLVLPPALWLFAELSLTPGFVLRRKHLLLFLPAIAQVLFALSWAYYQRWNNVRLDSPLNNSFYFFTTEVLPIIGTVASLWAYGRKLWHRQQGLPQQSLGVELGYRLRAYGFFCFMTILTILWIGGVLVKWPVFGAVEFLLVLFLFAYGYVGYIDETFFALPVQLKAKGAEKSPFPQYDDTKQLQRLAAAFQQDALHIQSKLTLEELADRLHLPPRYVSYLINACHNTNFSGLVNTYRVKEVIRKLHDPTEQHKTLLALAYESGFSSKSTFNQVFKEHTGQTPSQYVKRVPSGHPTH